MSVLQLSWKRLRLRRKGPWKVPDYVDCSKESGRGNPLPCPCDGQYPWVSYTHDPGLQVISTELQGPGRCASKDLCLDSPFRCRSPACFQFYHQLLPHWRFVQGSFQLGLNICIERWLLRSGLGRRGTLGAYMAVWVPGITWLTVFWVQKWRQWIGVAWPDECRSCWNPSFTLEPTGTGGPSCGLLPTFPHLLRGLKGLQKVVPEDERGPGKMDRYSEDFPYLWIEAHREETLPWILQSKSQKIPELLPHVFLSGRHFQESKPSANGRNPLTVMEMR